MLNKYTLPATVLAIAGAAATHATEVAVCTDQGRFVIELADVIKGWSVQRQLLGQSVYNDKDERIGTIEDIIITPERSASYAIVGTGGFLGIGTHDVAVPSGQFQMKNDRVMLPGATKELIRAMPPFEYVRK